MTSLRIRTLPRLPSAHGQSEGKYRSRQEKDAEHQAKWRAKSASADADVRAGHDASSNCDRQDAGGTRLREGEGEGEGYPALLEDIPSPSPPPGTPPPERRLLPGCPPSTKFEGYIEEGKRWAEKTGYTPEEAEE